MTTTAYSVLWAAYLAVSFITTCYFIRLLEQASWRAGEYFHILSRDNLRWLPTVFMTVPTAALCLGYGLLGAVLLILFAAAACLPYCLGASVARPDFHDTNVRFSLILWGILWFLLLGICYLLRNTAGSLIPVICCAAFMFIPFLVPILYKVGRPVIRLAGNRYIHVTNRVRALHKGLKVILLAGDTDTAMYANAILTVLSVKYQCETAAELVRNDVEAAHVIRNIQNPLTEILVCRVRADSGDMMTAIVRVLQPDIVVRTAADFVTLSDGMSIAGGEAICCVNGDDEILRQNIHREDVLTYGFRQDNDLCCSVSSVSPEGTVVCVRRSRSRKSFFSTELLGKQNITALAGAVSVALILGLPAHDIARGIAAVKGIPHRMQVISEAAQDAETVWIDDSGNRDPEEAEEALETLRQFEGSKVLITAGFSQLGVIQETANHHFGGAAAAVCDKIILSGNEPVFGLRQGIIDAGFMPDQIVSVGNKADIPPLIRKWEKDGGRQVVLIESGPAYTELSASE